MPFLSVFTFVKFLWCNREIFLEKQNCPFFEEATYQGWESARSSFVLSSLILNEEKGKKKSKLNKERRKDKNKGGGKKKRREKEERN